MTLRISGGRKLLSPPGAIARPTASRVRLAVMNLLADTVPGCRWLDLCCGSGVMACEALQRGAREVVAIERDRRVAAIARQNLEAVASSLQASGQGEPYRVINAEAQRWLVLDPPSGGTREPFDLIYLDPPWPAGLHRPLSEAVRHGGWLRREGTLIWECPSDHRPEVPEGWRLSDERRYGGSTLVLLHQV